MALAHPPVRAVSPALLGAALLAALAIAVCVSGCKADADTQTAPPTAEADTQKALQAAADFLGLPPTDLRFEEIEHEPWRDVYRFVYAEYRTVGVEMPACKVVFADLPEQWTKAHNEEMVGPIEDEAVARRIAERFVTKHYRPLPEDWSVVVENPPQFSTSSFDYHWGLCYKGVRAAAAGISVVVLAKPGRVIMCSCHYMPVQVPLTPKITEEQAKAIADAQLKRGGLYDKSNKRLQHCWLKVSYYPRDAEPAEQKQRLMWEIVYAFPFGEAELAKHTGESRRNMEIAPPTAWFFIDAQSGEMLESFVSELLEVWAPPPPH